MATFYSVWGPTYNAYRCYISESRSQNITNNTSTVSVTSYFETRSGWGIEDANTHVRARVRGSNVIDKTYNLSVGVNASKNIGSGSRTLSHNADGTLSNSAVELLVNTRNTGLFNNTASGSISHPTIPRATTPSSGNFTTGSATSISLPRASSSFTHEVTYKVGSATGTISSSAGTTASWTPAHSLGQQFKNATSATVTITVKTKNGSTVIGTKTMNKTLTLASSQVPSVSSVTFTDQNSTIVSNIGAYVQGKSELKATISGSGIHGSTIPAGDDKRRVTINGTTYNQGAIIPLPSSGSRDYTGRITDSRGRQGTLSGSINVLPYTEPQFVNVRAYRSATASGTESNDGKYLRIQLQTQVQSLVVDTQKNWHSIQVRTRPTGGAWSNRNTISNAGLAYNSTINVSGGAIFSDTSSYYVEITIVDRVGVAVQYTDRVSTAIPALDMHGTSVGIGKMHEQGALDVGAGGIFDNGRPVISFGGNLTSQNLNTVTERGWYIQTSSSNINTSMNYPVAYDGVPRPGFLEVIGNRDDSGTGVGILQRYTTYFNNDNRQTWTRTYYDSWSPWKEIDPKPDDTGWILGNYSSPFSNYDSGVISRPKWRRINGVTYIQGVATAPANTVRTFTAVPMFTLPAGFRPLYRADAIFQGSSYNRWFMVVGSNGVVTAARYGPDSTHGDGVWLPFSLSFPAEQ